MRRFVLILLLLLPGFAAAETRVALVLAAERYEALRPLANPLNDARAVEEVLLGLGFEVYVETNRDLRRMRRALEDFALDAEGADVALIYFAGHGMEVAGRNMLLPVDAPAGSAQELAAGSLPLDEVAETLQRVSSVGLLILDACRSDPFGGTGGATGRGAMSLARPAEVTPGLARIGRADRLLYAFSAAPGQAALDGQGENSPFTEALTRHLATPGLEIRQVLTLVQQDVYDRTRGAQLPYVESGLPAVVFAGGRQALPERESLLLAMAGLQPAHRTLIENIAADNDMPLAPLFAAFLSADLATRSVQDQTSELTAAATAFTALRRDMARLASDDPRVSALRAEAEAQLSLGAVTLARSKLTEAAGIDRASRETLKENYVARTLSEAETHYLNAKAAEADLRRDLAIADYERAVALYDEVREPGAPVNRTYLMALDALGTAYLFAGQLAEARRTFTALVDLTEAQAASDPGNSDWQRDISVAHNKIGDIATATGDLAAARRHHRAALAISERLVAQDGDNTQWLRDLSVSHDKIGNLAVASGDLGAARAAFSQALAIATGLVARDPANMLWQRDLGVSHQRLGVVEMAAGDQAAAEAHHRADLAIAEALVAGDPANTEYRRDLSLSHIKLGDVARMSQDYAAAREAYAAGLAISRDLVARDPNNTQWQRDLAIGHNKLGDMALEFDRVAEAQEHYEADLAITAALSARDPLNAQWRRDLAISQDNLGSAAHAAGDLTAAAASYTAALDIRRDLAARDPDNVDAQRDLGVSHSKLGDLAREAGDLATARDHYRQDLAIMERLAARDPENIGWQLDLVISHVRLFQSEDSPLTHINGALAILGALDAAGRLPEANRPWMTLMKEARAGFTVPE